MKTAKLILAGITICGAAFFLSSCGQGGGDDHATQNENADTMESDDQMQDDAATDTSMMGTDTTTTM